MVDPRDRPCGPPSKGPQGHRHRAEQTPRRTDDTQNGQGAERSVAWLSSRRHAAPNGYPPASSARGSVLVSVIPGATLTSRNQGTPDASTIMSVRDRSRRPRTECTVSAAAATASATGADNRAGV